jgi:hypothetical protein
MQLNLRLEFNKRFQRLDETLASLDDFTISLEREPGDRSDETTEDSNAMLMSLVSNFEEVVFDKVGEEVESRVEGESANDPSSSKNISYDSNVMNRKFTSLASTVRSYRVAQDSIRVRTNSVEHAERSGKSCFKS